MAYNLINKRLMIFNFDVKPQGIWFLINCPLFSLVWLIQEEFLFTRIAEFPERVSVDPGGLLTPLQHP